MEQLPYDLNFMHKYNLHKLLGLLIEDDDLRFIAGMYGVGFRDLRRIEEEFQSSIERLAGELRERVQPKPLDTPCRIAAIGDSISSDRQSWVKILNRFWDDDTRSVRRVIDCAISGDTSSDLINRFYGSVLNEDFQWAVLFIGTNDCRELGDDAHVSNISLDEYQRNMAYLMESLLSRGKKVINVTIPPVDNERLRAQFPDNNWRYDRARIDKTNEFIRHLAKKSGTSLADLAKKIDEYGGEVLESDGIHLNGRGQFLLCELLLDLIP
jgi:lysophospholipase L1-like esterase